MASRGASTTIGEGTRLPDAAKAIRESDAHGGYVPALDGVRAVSIALVLFSHSVIYRDHSSWLIELGRACGSTGVTIFFVLSGFLITTLMLRECATTARLDIARFYARRAARILPPYGVLLAVLLVLSSGAFFGDSYLRRDVLISTAFLRNIFGRSHETAHLWSLSLEEQFYLIWPAAFMFVVRRRAASILWRVIFVLLGYRVVLDQLSPISPGVLYERTDMRFDSLLIGCLLAFMRHTVQSRPIEADRARRLPADILPPIALAAALAADVYGSATRLTHVCKLTAVAGFAALTLDSLLRCPAGMWARLCSLTPVRYVGRLSYSIYLWQQLFLGPQEGGRALLRQNIPLCILFTVAAAAASYHLVEMPFLKFKKRFLKPRSRRAQAPFERVEECGMDESVQLEPVQNSDPDVHTAVGAAYCEPRVPGA